MWLWEAVHLRSLFIHSDPYERVTSGVCVWITQGSLLKQNYIFILSRNILIPVKRTKSLSVPCSNRNWIFLVLTHLTLFSSNETTPDQQHPQHRPFHIRFTLLNCRRVLAASSHCIIGPFKLPFFHELILVLLQLNRIEDQCAATARARQYIKCEGVGGIPCDTSKLGHNTDQTDRQISSLASPLKTNTIPPSPPPST